MSSDVGSGGRGSRAVGITLAFGGSAAYGASLITVWCSTPRGTGLFGRPLSPVLVERFGVDYPVQGFGGVVLLLICATLTATGRGRWIAVVGSSVVGAAGLARIAIGDRQGSSVGEVQLFASGGLVLATLAATAVTLAAVLRVRTGRTARG